MSEFPFSAKSLLQMCWGMTLNFSHDTQQQALGAKFNAQFDQLNQIFMPRLMTDLSDSNANFLLNLEMAISGSVRNLGFIRGTHMGYLSCNADRLNSRRQAVEKMADLSSFSGSGLFAKVGSFFGVGSFANLVPGLKLSPAFIGLFIVLGIIGAFAVTIGVRAYINYTDDSWDWKIRKQQNRYWKEHYKIDASDELFNLYRSIKELIEKFYPAQTATDIINKDPLLRLHRQPGRVKKIVRDEILATDDLQWFPIIQTVQTSPQPTSSQTQPTQTQGASP